MCPAGAIRDGRREVGVVEAGHAGEAGFIQGRLRVGEAMSPPAIREVKKHLAEREAKGDVGIVDAPPGTSCPVVAALRGVDLVLLVTEPTPFGLNDLKLAVGLVRELGLPFGVVINRDGIGNDETEGYCQAEGIDIVAKLADDRRIAEAYSVGAMIVDAVRDCRDSFGAIREYVEAAWRVK